MKVDKNLILNDIKKHLGLKKEKDFAEFLDIKPTALANWRKRNTYDAVLLYTKCEFLDADVLLKGYGDVIKTKSTEKSNIINVTENVTENTGKRKIQKKVTNDEDKKTTSLDGFIETKSTENLTLSKGKKKGKENEEKRKIHKTLPFDETPSIEDIITERVISKLSFLDDLLGVTKLLSNKDDSTSLASINERLDQLECFMEAMKLRVKIETEIEKTKDDNGSEANKEDVALINSKKKHEAS